MNVTSYQIWTYGSKQGYENKRAYIQLRNGSQVVAGISFVDPGMVFEADSDATTSTFIKMHLPSEMFQSVVDILRNEKPMNVFFV